MDDFNADLIKTFCLEPLKSNLTIIDIFKLQCTKYNEAYKTFLKLEKRNNKSLSKLQSYIIDMELNPLSEYSKFISQNHFTNYFSDIDFVLGNVHLLNTKLFDNIYADRHYIANMAEQCIHYWKSLDKIKIDGVYLSEYYNQEMVQKFIDMLEKLKKLDESKLVGLNDGVYEKYNDFWDVHFIPNIKTVLMCLKSIKSKFKKDNDKIGVYKFPCLYEYLLESHISIKVRIEKSSTYTDIIAEYKEKKYITTATLIKWANLNITRIKNRIVEIAKNLFNKKQTSQLVSELDYKKILELFTNIESEKYSSPEEMANHHNLEIKKHIADFLNYGFKEYAPVTLTVLNDKTQAGGYYYANTFFLNVCNWDSHRKYEARALTLHETTPGHHLQIHTANYLKNIEYASLVYSSYFNGFIEGWGLFSEKLGNNSDLDSRQKLLTEFGSLEMEMLRTLRIVADLKLNAEGLSAANVIAYMSENLSMSVDGITAEVYRYISVPGQALAYRIGCEVFCYLHHAKFENSDKLSPESMQMYKDLINNGHCPLGWLI
jgi:hypothetical protein